MKVRLKSTGRKDLPQNSIKIDITRKEIPFGDQSLIYPSINSLKIRYADESLKVFKKLIPNKTSNLKYINLKKNLGYGNGILQGLDKSKGEFLGWTHADLQTNPADALKNFKLFLNSFGTF